MYITLLLFVSYSNFTVVGIMVFISKYNKKIVEMYLIYII